MNQLAPPVFPCAWASAWGEDQYGLWMELTCKETSYVFRWILPGEFMMGSPENEKERDDDEDLHRVKLTRGFWLGETAVIQQLWQAVMDDNPSTFKGKNRPVEQVSWKDAKEFMDRLSGLHPDLSLRLPWEAEWEYGCRAGTTTPFSFGDNITPEQVNYDGEVPYNDGEKGEYREETVGVKSLPCNQWGLYEMHGNVWEWCEDGWQKNLGTNSVTDPWQDVGEAGEFRVLRSGSWFDGGRRCRSAIRNGFVPDFRVDDSGFRLALGHSQPEPVR